MLSQPKKRSPLTKQSRRSSSQPRAQHNPSRRFQTLTSRSPIQSRTKYHKNRTRTNYSLDNLPTSPLSSLQAHPLTRAARSVSFVNAKFQIVQVQVQSKIPELMLLASGDATSNNEETSDRSQHNKQNRSDRQSQFLNPAILSDPKKLLEFANAQPKGTTFMAKKADLSDFYSQNHRFLSEQSPKQSQGEVPSQLLLGSGPIKKESEKETETETETEKGKGNVKNQYQLQLDLQHKEQQIALQRAPVAKVQDLADQENEKRRLYYNSTNAKPLELFKLPKKSELQSILAASKGDIGTVQQIIGKAYYDCLNTMGLLPKRFQDMHKNTLNPLDWAEIEVTDVDMAYTPLKYQFLVDKDAEYDPKSRFPPQSNALGEFFEWLDSSFNPETLSRFRESNLYTYNISSQLQKGGGVLHHASQGGNIKLVKFLLKHGAEVNQRTSNNSTPLHWAAGAGWLDIVKELIEGHGADIHASTNSWSVDVFGRDSGQAPIAWAASSGHLSIVEYLYGLSPISLGLKDEKDNSVVCVAKKGLHFDTIRWIQKSVQEEYVPVRLEIHTVEQNMFFDHTKMTQRGAQGQGTGHGDGDGDQDGAEQDDGDVVDLSGEVNGGEEDNGSKKQGHSQAKAP